MKKKFITLLLTSICVLSSLSLYAEDTTITQDSASKTATVNVTVSKPETYEVLIPKNITANIAKGGSTAQVASNIIASGDIAAGRVLQFDISSCVLTNTISGTSNSITATIENTTGANNYFTVDELASTDKANYPFNVSVENVKSGNYEGSFTITFSIVPAPSK